jgi:hypothetical protein
VQRAQQLGGRGGEGDRNEAKDGEEGGLHVDGLLADEWVLIVWVRDGLELDSEGRSTCLDLIYA